MNAVVIYWSATGNTEAIAEKISNTLGVEAKKVSDVTVDEALKYDTLILGCPAMGAEELEDTEFRPFYDELVSKGKDKKYAFFGAYGWGGGEWMNNWLSEASSQGLNVLGSIISSGGADEIEGDFDSFISAIKA